VNIFQKAKRAAYNRIKNDLVKRCKHRSAAQIDLTSPTRHCEQCGGLLFDSGSVRLPLDPITD